MLAVLAFTADVTAFSVLRFVWGRRAGLLYLFVGLPLQGFIYQRIDLVSVALAVAALGLSRRSRERAGGIAAAAAVLFKLWPVALDSLRNAAGASITVTGWMSLARNALLILVIVAWCAERHGDASTDDVPHLRRSPPGGDVEGGRRQGWRPGRP